MKNIYKWIGGTVHYIRQLLENKILWIVLMSYLSSAGCKIVINGIKTHKLDLSLIYGTGGMPSSHSAFVNCLSWSVGFTNGFNSNAFAITFVLSCIVMYDASNIRQAVGKHAEILNIIMDNISNIHKRKFNLHKRLNELLGHKPVEVLGGAVVGFIVSLLTLI